MVSIYSSEINVFVCSSTFYSFQWWFYYWFLCVGTLAEVLCTPVPMYIYFSVILYYNITEASGMFYLRWVMWLHCTRQVTAVAPQHQLSSYFNMTFEQSGSSQYAVLLIFRNGASSLPTCSRLSMLCVSVLWFTCIFIQQVVHVVCSIWIRCRRLLCLQCRGSLLGLC